MESETWSTAAKLPKRLTRSRVSTTPRRSFTARLAPRVPATPASWRRLDARLGWKSRLERAAAPVEHDLDREHEVGLLLLGERGPRRELGLARAAHDPPT